VTRGAIVRLDADAGREAILHNPHRRALSQLCYPTLGQGALRILFYASIAESLYTNHRILYRTFLHAKAPTACEKVVSICVSREMLTLQSSTSQWADLVSQALVRVSLNIRKRDFVSKMSETLSHQDGSHLWLPNGTSESANVEKTQTGTTPKQLSRFDFRTSGR